MRHVSYLGSFFYLAQGGQVELSTRTGERSRQVRALRAQTWTDLSTQQAAALRLYLATLYRWEQRLKEEGLRGLEDRGQPPRNSQRP